VMPDSKGKCRRSEADPSTARWESKGDPAKLERGYSSKKAKFETDDERRVDGAVTEQPDKGQAEGSTLEEGSDGIDRSEIATDTDDEKPAATRKPLKNAFSFPERE
jgi:hypothetical protein